MKEKEVNFYLKLSRKELVRSRNLSFSYGNFYEVLVWHGTLFDRIDRKKLRFGYFVAKQAMGGFWRKKTNFNRKKARIKKIKCYFLKNGLLLNQHSHAAIRRKGHVNISSFV